MAPHDIRFILSQSFFEISYVLFSDSKSSSKILYGQCIQTSLRAVSGGITKSQINIRVSNVVRQSPAQI